MGNVTAAAVRNSLKSVMDPHMSVSLVDMGMIRNIDVSDTGEVTVSMVFPCIGCPAWSMIQEEMRETISALEGVRSVRVRVDWTEKWTKDDLSESARDRAHSFGYVI
ncbi:MAG: metal-sulfur cluster assembly factor [Rhizobiaceae bacterium]|nr:metal-sulfur cluster assembly factor [Rhizobiaceae bacterium]